MPSFLAAFKPKTEFRYVPIGPNQIRLLRYAKDSRPDSIRLQIQSFDRETVPRYIALSYVWGKRTPVHKIKLNNQRKTVQPNLHNALQCMRNGLQEWFWIDALCIDQGNLRERNEQVRQMEQTYKNALQVASWLGLCSDRLRPLFDPQVRTTNYLALSPARRKQTEMAVETLVDLEYWTRIWIQQELLLNPNIILWTSEYSQSLQSLFAWESNQGKHMISGINLFASLNSAVDWAKWRKAPVLRLLTWARQHRSSDPRDKVFALLTLTADHERAALQRYFPDYGLCLAQVVMVTLVHIRHFSGQKRAARQLDSVLECFGETPESTCANVVSTYFHNLNKRSVVVNGRRVLQVPSRERRDLDRQQLFVGQEGRLSVLDVCDCIFSVELGDENDQDVDVRSSRTWQRSGTWVLDPPLSRELNRFWFASISQEMGDMRM